MHDLLISYKFDILFVDGSDPESKQLRDKLFEISGKRGKYPQCFLLLSDDTYKFIGLWEEVITLLIIHYLIQCYIFEQLESLADCESLPSEVLSANPNIQTISNVSRIPNFTSF